VQDDAAAVEQRVQIVLALLQANAAVDTTDDGQRTPLHIAAASGCTGWSAFCTAMNATKFMQMQCSRVSATIVQA
jgi:ankyrin repeat protein